MNTKNSQPVLYSLLPKDEAASQILKKRAQYLSENKNEALVVSTKNSYVRFLLGEQEYYGIPYNCIKEVIINTAPTKVPNTPNFIAGIINRNSALITVIDLKPIFNINAVSSGKQFSLIVIGIQGLTMAILVDYIQGSDVYEPSKLELPLNTENAINPKYILGLHEGTTAILNMEAILSDTQLNKTLLWRTKNGRHYQ